MSFFFSIQWLLSLFSPLLLQDPQQRTDNLREGANDQGSQSIRDFKSADRAYKNAKHGQAKSLSIKAREHQAEMKKLNKQAENLVYSMRNSNPKQAEIEIDLHGLYVSEAVERAKVAMDKARSKGKSQLRIIVGKGIHSQGQISRLRPAIEKMASERKLDCSVDPTNSGVLVIQLAEATKLERFKWLIGLILLIGFLLFKSRT